MKWRNKKRNEKKKKIINIESKTNKKIIKRKRKIRIKITRLIDSIALEYCWTIDVISWQTAWSDSGWLPQFSSFSSFSRSKSTSTIKRWYFSVQLLMRLLIFDRFRNQVSISGEKYTTDTKSCLFLIYIFGHEKTPSINAPLFFESFVVCGCKNSSTLTFS